MTTIDIHDDNFSDFTEKTIAIEFLFKFLSPERCSHLAQVIKDNIEYNGIDGYWTYDKKDGLTSLKSSHMPRVWDTMAPQTGMMLKSIKRDMNRITKAYNKLCRTDIEYDSFKVHFFDTMRFPDYN